MDIVEKIEGDRVRIEKFMENPKNRQMGDFGLQEVEFGIGSSGKEICIMEFGLEKNSEPT